MNPDNHSSHQNSSLKLSFWRTPAGTVLVVFLCIVGLLLVFEHRAHIFGDWVLFLPLLLCIGMHFFMHGKHGHGGHHGHQHQDNNDDGR